MERALFNNVLDRQGAVAYAQKWWQESDSNNNDLTNKDYVHYIGNDCTNFVSQCWCEGGGIDKTPGWFSYFAKTETTSNTWVGVDKFADYMTNTSASYTADNLSIAEMKWSSNDAQIGDIIQFYSNARGYWFHSVIITGIDPKLGILYAAHTASHLQKPLSDVYPSKGSDPVDEVRFICARHSK